MTTTTLDAPALAETGLPGAGHADAVAGTASGRAGGGRAALVLAGVERSLAELRALPLDTEPDEGLVASIDGLARAERMLAAERHRRVAAADARGSCRSVGARSTATMLATRLGLTRGEANRAVDTATALAELPETASALAAGELGVGQAEAAAAKLAYVARGHTGGADALEDAIAGLDRVAAEEGKGLDRARLRQRLDVWADQAGHDPLATAEARAWRRRRAWLSQPKGPDRMARLTADLPPTQAAKLRAALDPLLRKDSADDDRDPEQRCADALAALADRALDAGDSPQAAAQRPHVLLIATADTLAARPGARPRSGPAWLDGHGPVSSESARQVACDAEATTVTLGADGSPLDVGRARRDPGRKLRAAVIARDKACVGCGAAVSRSEVHHIQHWSQGGPTDLANLVLVCWDCHTHLHHHDWRITLRPDGTYRCGPPRQPSVNRRARNRDSHRRRPPDRDPPTRLPQRQPT